MKIGNMKLSVFVVTYNQEKYIRQCLDGILMQKVDFDYEVVIGEDHGTDGTRAICEEYAAKYPQVKLLPLKERLGIARNWQRVLSECHGEYIAMCEGDDYWTDENKLQMEVDLLDSDKEIGYVFTKNQIETSDGTIINRDASYVGVPSKMDLHQLTNLWLPSHTQTVCFRRDLLPTPYPDVMESADFICDICLKYIVASKCKIGYIDKNTAVYRMGGITSAQSDFDAYIRKRRSDLQKLDEYLHFEYSYFLSKQWKIHDCEQLTIRCFENGQRFKAIKYFFLKNIYVLLYNPKYSRMKDLTFCKYFIKKLLSFKR